jgi:hypothetical protein
MEFEVLFMNAKTDVIAMCLSYRNIHVNKTHNMNRYGNSLHSEIIHAHFGHISSDSLTYNN